MKSIVAVLLIATASISCSGQKGELTRSAAEAMIRKNSKVEEVTVNIRSFTMFSDQMTPQEKASVLFATNHLYGTLVVNDWVKEEPCHLSPDIGKGLNPTFHCFTPKNGDARMLNAPQKGPFVEDLQLILFRKKLSKIVGIRQEGNEADAKVEIQAEMTDSYKNVFRIMRDLTMQCRCVSAFWPEGTPTNETWGYHFVKWDDGWHLEGRNDNRVLN
jgi:hypothetical protein